MSTHHQNSNTTGHIARANTGLTGSTDGVQGVSQQAPQHQGWSQSISGGSTMQRPQVSTNQIPPLLPHPPIPMSTKFNQPADQLYHGQATQGHSGQNYSAYNVYGFPSFSGSTFTPPQYAHQTPHSLFPSNTTVSQPPTGSQPHQFYESTPQFNPSVPPPAMNYANYPPLHR